MQKVEAQHQRLRFEMPSEEGRVFSEIRWGETGGFGQHHEQYRSTVECCFCLGTENRINFYMFFDVGHVMGWYQVCYAGVGEVGDGNLCR